MAEQVQLEVLTDEERKELEAHFHRVDADGSGSIDLGELGAVCVMLGIDPKGNACKQLMMVADKDQNGTLSLEEFISFLHGYKGVSDQDELKDTFLSYDTDGSGYITHKELRNVMRWIQPDKTSSDVKKMIDEVDVNGDGKVDYQEFAKLVQLMDQ